MLGPLEAVAAGEALPLGGPKQRALLALLLIHANEVVSIDTLIEELWGDSPPRTAPAYIQNCVSRLRRVLGPELLETRPPGYVLRVEPETIDARRFERLALEVRDAPARERAAGLRDALQLWHGPPLGDLAFESFAQTEARRLDELRLAALEERIEAELELGMHAELVGELEVLAREHPARERLRRLQMLALYRAGRQVDALAAYQEARLALDELGLEPSEELRALERMILVHDPVARRRGAGRGRKRPARRRRCGRRGGPVCVLLAELVLDPALDPEAARREASRCLAEVGRRSSSGTAARSSSCSARRSWRSSASRPRTRTTRCARCAPRSSCATPSRPSSVRAAVSHGRAGASAGKSSDRRRDHGRARA